MRPAAEVNPDIHWLLKELGITLTERTPKLVTGEMVAAASRVVTFGSLDRCPSGTEQKSEDWPLAGATGRTPDQLRAIRDELSARVAILIRDHCLSAEWEGNDHGP